MNYRQVTQRLKTLGCEFRREAKGSHEIWWHPVKKRYTTIPRHGNKDIAEGTLRKILRDLEISKSDWEKNEL